VQHLHNRRAIALKLLRNWRAIKIASKSTRICFESLWIDTPWLRNRLAIAVRVLSNDFAIAAQRLRVERSDCALIAAIAAQLQRGRYSIVLQSTRNRRAIALELLWIDTPWLHDRFAIAVRVLSNDFAIAGQS
jgi:hypothetical protein